MEKDMMSKRAKTNFLNNPFVITLPPSVICYSIVFSITQYCENNLIYFFIDKRGLKSSGFSCNIGEIAKRKEVAEMSKQYIKPIWTYMAIALIFSIFIPVFLGNQQNIY